MLKACLIVSPVLSLSMAVSANDAIEFGKNKSEELACASCHGKNGVGKFAIIPNLAGQKAPYIVIALKAYRDGERKGGNAAQMVSLSQRMSEEEMKAIAAYYASLPAAK